MGYKIIKAKYDTPAPMVGAPGFADHVRYKLLVDTIRVHNLQDKTLHIVPSTELSVDELGHDQISFIYTIHAYEKS